MTSIRNLEHKFEAAMTAYCNLPAGTDALIARAKLERMQNAYAELRTERQIIERSFRMYVEAMFGEEIAKS